MSIKINQKMFQRLALLVLLFLGACAGKAVLPTTGATPSAAHEPATNTATTPDPRLTATSSPAATFEDARLAAYYLTPFTPPQPTRTGVPSPVPTANIQALLPGIVIRKATPQPLPAIQVGDTSTRQPESEWGPAYVQAATDLMNSVDGNREEYLQYIEAWQPMALSYSPDDWFLKADFDNDGQAEWLVSVPVQVAPDEFGKCGWTSQHGYCARLFFIFEKIGDSYHPMHVFRQDEWLFSEARVALVKDLNQDGKQEIVFRADPCGAAVCSTDLYIGNWDGQSWESLGYIGNDYAQVSFADLDGNGSIEIRLAYSTYAASRYNYPYSDRKVVDIYGWKNKRYEIVDQIYPPAGSVFETIWDIDSVLAYKNTELALCKARHGKT